MPFRLEARDVENGVVYREDGDEVGVAAVRFIIVLFLFIGLPLFGVLALSPLLFGAQIYSRAMSVFGLCASLALGVLAVRRLPVAKETFRYVHIDSNAQTVTHYVHPRHAIGNTHDGVQCPLSECVAVFAPIKVKGDSGLAVFRGTAIVVCVRNVEFAIAVQKTFDGVASVIDEVENLGMRVQTIEERLVIRGLRRRSIASPGTT